MQFDWMQGIETSVLPPISFKGAQSVRTSEYWQMAVVFESQPPFYIAVTLAMEASHRCVHGNSYSFYPLPRAYGNEYELVWWFDSTLCYYLVSLTIHSLHL